MPLMDLDLILNNKEKFLKYNSLKIDRFQSLITNVNVYKVISAIPFLLSINKHKLPGFIEGPVPLGVVNYRPDAEIKRFIVSKFHIQEGKLEIVQREPFVQMLSLIGSVGTIAYNKFSDFDFWVCIDSKIVNEKELANFRKKVKMIQEWVISQISLDVNLFVNDVNLIKQNKFDDTDDEAFGSTLGALLKDEFYRSSIVLNGKIPFWWVVPVNTDDKKYDELFSELSEEHKRESFLDLGNLYKISKEDFLGAALFQIVKSLGNPFKSILKLGVLEKYLFNPENAPLISHKLKFNIHQDKISNTVLDSYLMMFHEVFTYYEKNGLDADMLLILKMNLYLKIRPQLSKYASVKLQSNIPYKVVEMFKYCKKWQWDMAFVNDLDNFDNWDFQKVMGFWAKVQKFMLLSYQRISSQFAGFNIRDRISESDFKLLSRKINSHFRSTQDKVEQFLSFRETPSESILYVEPYAQNRDRILWKISKKDNTSSPEGTEVIIRTGEDLSSLLVWAVLNRIYDHTVTRVSFQSGNSKRMDKNIVIDFMYSMSNFFQSDSMKSKNVYYVKEVFNLLNYLVLDLGLQPEEKIKTVDFVFHTSWGESFINKYYSDDCLSSILSRIVKDGINLKKPFEKYCCFYAPDIHRKVYKEIYSIFKNAYEFIVENDNNKVARFSAKVASKYVIITRKDETIDAVEYPSKLQFLIYLNSQPVGYVKNKIYSGLDNDFAGIELALQNSEPNMLSLFFEQKGDLFYMYIVNEEGNIFIFFKPKQVFEKFMTSLFVYSQSAVKLVREVNKYSPLNERKIPIRQIVTDKIGKLTLQDRTTDFMELKFGRFSKINGYSVNIECSDDKIIYLPSFDNGTKTTYMEYNQLNLLAGLIKQSQNKYENIMIDVSLGKHNFGSNLSTSFFFRERFKVEIGVEKFLAKG